MTPEYLSASRIGMYGRCAQQYKYRYGDGIISPPGIAFARGKSQHHSQEINLKWYKQEGALLPTTQVQQLAADKFDDYMQEEEYVLGGQYADMTLSEARGKAKDEAVKLAGLHSDAVAPLIEPAEVERRIEVLPSNLLPIKFVGIVDVIDTHRTIIDTKTTGKSPGATVADDSDQLTAYAYCHAHEFGIMPTGYRLDHLVCTPKTGKTSYKPQETERDVQDVKVWLNRANTMLKAVEAEVFVPTPTDSWVCNPKWCGYTDICPYYRGRKRPES